MPQVFVCRRDQAERKVLRRVLESGPAGAALPDHLGGLKQDLVVAACHLEQFTLALFNESGGELHNSIGDFVSLGHFSKYALGQKPDAPLGTVRAWTRPSLSRSAIAWPTLPAGAWHSPPPVRRPRLAPVSCTITLRALSDPASPTSMRRYSSCF